MSNLISNSQSDGIRPLDMLVTALKNRFGKIPPLPPPPSHQKNVVALITFSTAQKKKSSTAFLHFYYWVKQPKKSRQE